MDENRKRRFRSELKPLSFSPDDVPAAAIMDGALDEDFPHRLIELARKNRQFFEPSTILDGKVTDQRRSQTCVQIEDLKAEIQAANSEHFSAICSSLGIEPFQLGTIEAQLTFHQDGDFFRCHRDNRGLTTRSRLISYVYYFRTETADFEGGELCLYKTHPLAEKPTTTDPSVTVRPLHNRIVFFASDTLHEVLPIKSRSKDFIQGRGSIVGWLRTCELDRIKPMPSDVQ